MRVILAESAGFCFGVKRAMESVLRELDKGKKIYTYGPLIHNQIVVEELAEKGVEIISDLDSLESLEGSTVVIRSHGVSRQVFERLEALGAEVVDATCPFVKRIHGTVERESYGGTTVLIVGDISHPEVRGIMGWCLGDVIVVSGPEEAEKLPECTGEEAKKLCVVAQTTLNYNIFQESVEIIRNKGYNVTVVNTICNATGERQTEAQELAGKCGAMIVIGDPHSSNTKKLFEICKKECEHTYLIQRVRDLPPKLPEPVDLVGITAGASTPNYIIEEVHNYVRTAEL